MDFSTSQSVISNVGRKNISSFVTFLNVEDFLIICFSGTIVINCSKTSNNEHKM